MKAVIWITLCMIFLTACSPSVGKVAEQTASAETAAAALWTSTQTASSTPTLLPTPTPSSTPSPTATRTPTSTPTPLPTCEPVADEEWAQVILSEDIVVYADYLEANPETEHIEELKYLVDHFFRVKIEEAEKDGKQIVKNAKLIEGYSGQGIFGPGATLFLGGGNMPLIEGTFWYSDPTDVLAVQTTTEGIRYVQGRGVVIIEDKVYMMGLPDKPLLPQCQP